MALCNAAAGNNAMCFFEAVEEKTFSIIVTSSGKHLRLKAYMDIN
jgi:hypothetical protein